MLEILECADLHEDKSRDDLLALYPQVFDDELTHSSYDELMLRQNLTFLIAYWQGQPAGFKVGYSLPNAEEVLYSWIGGTAPRFRRKGIAWKLMLEQHRRAAEAGRIAVETKCRPKWAAMMQLNYRAGFKLLREYRGQSCGETKFHLRKDLMT